jgi:hypothetical protein
MICPAACGQFWAGVTAGGVGGAAPGGDPSGASIDWVGATNYVRVLWTNYDTTVYTQIGHSTSTGVEPTSVLTVLPPETTEYETGYTAQSLGVDSGDIWWVRHYKNGQVGSWVEAGGSEPES